MSSFRAAIRALRASPLVSTMGILSLALGIGANAAMFSIVDALILRDLPVRHASRLAMLFDDIGGAGFWSHPIWESIKRRPYLFDGAFAYGGVKFNLMARATGTAAVSARIQAAILEVNQDVTTVARPFVEVVDAALSRERLVARLSSFFGLLALVLAALGLYGTTSYAVTRRHTELGIRMALGTAPCQIATLVLSSVARLLAIGLVAGGVVAWWASRFIESMLYELGAHDLPTMAGAATVLAVVALLAGWLPARRAARIEPAQVLRDA